MTTHPTDSISSDPLLTEALIAATVHCAFQGKASIMSVVPVEVGALHAILTAAVHAQYDGRARIVTFEGTHQDREWAREGRRDIFSSHRVR
ncbi:MAG: hypothetical protein WC205_04870 [Opitutaceae bacterium]|jgi:hypothetical protein